MRRLATMSFPLPRAFRVGVRAHWTSLLVPIALYPAFALDHSPAGAAAWAIGWTLALFAVLWTHQMGHVWAARAVGVDTASITLWPLGGLAHEEHRAPSAQAEIWIALAGPLTHAVWFVLVGTPYLFLTADSDLGSTAVGTAAQWFLTINAALLFLNLLPFWPMDGGRVLRGWIARRRSSGYASMITAYVGFAGAAVLVLGAMAVVLEFERDVAAATWGGAFLLCVGAASFVACRRLAVESRWSAGPYGMPPAHPRRSLPQASWSLEDATPGEPVAVEERRAVEKPRRVALETQRRREPARVATPPLHERIDELLDRINEVGGIEHLPEAERRELAEASERLKRGDS